MKASLKFFILIIVMSCFILTGLTSSSPKYNHGNLTFTKDVSSEISKGNNKFPISLLYYQHYYLLKPLSKGGTWNV
ncbi:hypothetical protein [Clostridium manihotivorum]|uniref:Uncharacterized protein n=1 Tax=Clostridium manihotivorum TaxID=2320868 RepID=A0A410DT38_9CLOT|nr:hypothetical protein [Clostridium manihotivorum]QAA32246.1 hypothetical protein C1I91_11685 [Clostridium manihotivorum]